LYLHILYFWLCAVYIPERLKIYIILIKLPNGSKLTRKNHTRNVHKDAQVKQKQNNKIVIILTTI